LVINVSKTSGRFLRLAMMQLDVDFVQKTLESVLTVNLSGVAVDQRHAGLDIPVLASTGESQNQSLACLNVIMVSQNVQNV